MLRLSELKRPLNSDRNKIALCYSDEEIGFYESYLTHFIVSKKLKELSFAKEAQFSLFTSIECFLKDIFCLTRFQVWKNIEPSSLCHPQFHKIVFNEITNIKSVCKVIGHDISKLSGYLSELYPNELGESDAYHTFPAKFTIT